MSAESDLLQLADDFGMFKTILIDVPWPSAVRKPKPGKGQWLAEHTRPRYKTMKMDDITRLPVSDIAEDDAMLVMWCTWSHLPLAFPLITHWGFKYATGFIWVKTCKNTPAGVIKPIYGPGVWFQHCSEIILLARRGHPFGKLGNPRPARKGILLSPRLGHSVKPPELQDWIDEKFPGPKLEMFARRRRVGWSSWGDQLEDR